MFELTGIEAVDDRTRGVESVTGLIRNLSDDELVERYVRPCNNDYDFGKLYTFINEMKSRWEISIDDIINFDTDEDPISVQVVYQKRLLGYKAFHCCNNLRTFEEYSEAFLKFSAKNDFDFGWGLVLVEIFTSMVEEQAKAEAEANATARPRSLQEKPYDVRKDPNNYFGGPLPDQFDLRTYQPAPGPNGFDQWNQIQADRYEREQRDRRRKPEPSSYVPVLGSALHDRHADIVKNATVIDRNGNRK